MVGQEVSFTEAADRTPVRNHRTRLTSGAQLVGNWVEVLGPVVTAASSENSWPETVVLDSTWFQVCNTWTGTSSRAFSVLGAYGYPASRPGRTWALHATPQARSADWQRLLRSLPGEPRMVICDSDRAIRAAVKQVWPNSFVKLCEHHLRVGAIEALAPYGLTGYGDPVMELLNEAFHSATDWRRFAVAVKGRGIVAEQWVKDHDEVVRAQARRRRHLPQHHSTGALDEVLAKVRDSWSHGRSATATLSAPTGCWNSCACASTEPTTPRRTPLRSERTSPRTTAGYHAKVSCETPRASTAFGCSCQLRATSRTLPDTSRARETLARCVTRL